MSQGIRSVPIKRGTPSRCAAFDFVVRPHLRIEFISDGSIGVIMFGTREGLEMESFRGIAKRLFRTRRGRSFPAEVAVALGLLMTGCGSGPSGSTSGDRKSTRLNSSHANI